MNTLFHLLQNILNTKDDINEKTVPADIKTWDSLNHLQIIHGLEEKYNITFDPKEIATCAEGTNKIIELLKKKGVSLAQI